MAELLETVMTAVFDIALLFLVIYSAKGRAANSGTRLVALTFSLGFLLWYFDLSALRAAVTP